jgi:antitoxin (DNA-binding transcriptional repressor) of toxin-antitoxin stability system
MLTISSRELQLNLGKYLSNLPVAITKYNKVVAKLVSVDEPSQTTKEYISYLEGQVAQFLKPSALEEERKLTYD